MKVRELMVSNPVCCHPETNLAAATALLWDHHCGALPVVDKENCAVGMITDRDICIALGTRNKRAAEIAVSEVMTGRICRCEPDTEIHEALTCMKQNHVRRLIVTEQGRVSGILSIDDIILNVQWSDHKDVELSFLDVIRVLRKVTYPAPAAEGACEYRALLTLGLKPATTIDKFVGHPCATANN